MLCSAMVDPPWQPVLNVDPTAPVTTPDPAPRRAARQSNEHRLVQQRDADHAGLLFLEGRPLFEAPRSVGKLVAASRCRAWRSLPAPDRGPDCVLDVLVFGRCDGRQREACPTWQRNR